MRPPGGAEHTPPSVRFQEQEKDVSKKAWVMVRNLLLAAVFPAVLGTLPAWAQGPEPGLAPEALNSLSRVHIVKIDAKPVFDIHGARIGSVTGVTPTGDGMVWSVTIRLEAGRQVNGQPANGATSQTILGSDASFDGQRVIADLPASPRG